MSDPRETLDRLIHERREDYTAMSRLLGRNVAYVQQFIHRGTPRKLDEADRRTLAAYFGVDEELLGGPPAQAQPAKSKTGMVMVPRLAVGASAGPGTVVGEEGRLAAFGFDARWLRAVSSTPAMLSMIQVSGDSMAPTLVDGDDIMVDRSDAADRVRDGIYVLRFDDVLMVKRLATNPVARSLSIRSDNPAYPDWEDCDPAQLAVIGRVAWIGRRLG
jgi:phage repressor protein C with HTH and peptisase S24 domain